MKIIKLAALLSYFALTSTVLHAEVVPGVLEKYKNNNVFVFVGIYSHINIVRAIDAGFTEMHGLDEDEVLVEHAKTIFPSNINPKPNTNYCLHHGGMAKMESVIAQIKKPITFLLSNHFPDMDEVKENTILQELEIIGNHPIKTHTILIEYINYASTSRFGNITLESIEKKLLGINPNYKFVFEKGGHLEQEEGAVLVAYVI